MKILAIELKNYNRLKLNDFNFIRIDFTESIQQILGSNGSGKSSILSQLNPLPADHKDFEKDGFKKIWISHRGSMYECISDFSHGNKHTFIKDGEILNDLGTAKVQLELVKEHFNYTKEIRDLQLGKVKFTKMSSADRRYWFDQLHTADYSFANKAFQFFKERLRDINGSLKENKRKLVFEQSKLLKEEEIKKIQGEVHKTYKEITELLEIRDNPNITLSEIMGKYDKLEKDIVTISKSILDTQSNNPTRFNEEDAILHEYESLKQELTRIDTKLSEKHREHKKIQDEVNLLKQSGLGDLEKLQSKLQILQSSIDDLKTKRLLPYLQIEHPNELVSALELIENELFGLINTIPCNESRYFSQSNLNAKKEECLKLEDHKAKLIHYINHQNAKKAHQEEHKSKGHIKCPKCAHSWILDYDEGTYQILIKTLEKASNELTEVESKIKTIKEEIDKMVEYGMMIRHYQSIKNGAPLLKSLWDEIQHKDYLIVAPNLIPNLFNQFKNDCLIESQVLSLQKDIDQIVKMQEMSKVLENKNLDSLSEKLDSFSKEISDLTLEKKIQENRINKLSWYLNGIKFIQEEGRRLESTLNELKVLDELTLKAVRFDIVNNKLREKQSYLTLREDMLSEINNQKNRILYLNEEIAKQEIDSKALTVLFKEISPTEGLIAEGMMGFINSYIDLMNHEIQKVWAYPLKIKGCQLLDEDSIDLDYKFPLIVKDGSGYRNDINEGSDGMQEIINIAFVLVSMKFLDMLDYPLYLDEFGTTFDETHRKKAVYLIKSLMDNYSFTQLFMVSHYLTMHGAISNAEVCVLNSENLNVIGEYNHHVKFN